MLVLSRHKDESIMIGDDVKVHVVDIRGDKVRVGIDAPQNVRVHRTEVYDAIKAANVESAEMAPQDVPGGGDVHAAQKRPPVKLAVFVSGGGTTLKNLIDYIGAGKLPAQIVKVVASRGGIGGIDIASNAGLPVRVVDHKQFADCESFSRACFDAIAGDELDLVCLGGWLRLIKVPSQFAGRVMNIHPALLPSFGGAGMYGHKVHEAVLASGCKVSGCTVHFVDETYDTGPIILQRTCEVKSDDTAESLGSRVFEQERLAYPAAIKLFQRGKIKLDGRRVIIS